ncbi:MAG: hypothetical protein ABWZ30_01985 [Jiangellaceae bacterium]
MRDSKPEDVVAHGIAILEAVGMPAEDARLVSESPVTSDMWGHPSHGMLRLPWYVTGDRPRNRQHLRRGHRPRRP